MDTLYTSFGYLEQMLFDWRLYIALMLICTAVLNHSMRSIQRATVRNGHSQTVSWAVAISQTALPIPLCIFMASNLEFFVLQGWIALISGIILTVAPSLSIHLLCSGFSAKSKRNNGLEAEKGVSIEFQYPQSDTTPVSSSQVRAA